VNRDDVRSVASELRDYATHFSEALERAFYAAADEGDTRGIESALILMAQIDPVRARKLYDDLRFVLEVEEMVDGMAMGGTDDA